MPWTNTWCQYNECSERRPYFLESISDCCGVVFKRRIRTLQRCVSQSPSSPGSLCPLSCVQGPDRWLCCSGRTAADAPQLSSRAVWPIAGWGCWASVCCRPGTALSPRSGPAVCDCPEREGPPTPAAPLLFSVTWIVKADWENCWRKRPVGRTRLSLNSCLQWLKWS